MRKLNSLPAKPSCKTIGVRCWCRNLINLTIAKQEDQAKQKALKDDPTLANGQDLAASEDLTPVQTLTKRYTRQLERIGRTKSDDVLERILNAMTLTYDPHSNYFPTC